MTTSITIVVPCHNRKDQLRLTLEALSQQTCPFEKFEVIVVDQASTDGARELVRMLKTPYKLHLIEQDGKYGISVSRNAGAEAANSPIVMYLDADQIADPGLVEAHLACHAAYPGTVVCGRVLPYLPAYKSFIDRAANPEVGLDRGRPEGPMPCYEAFGNQLSFSIETFRKIGPYDVSFRRYQDIEFACRADQVGVRFTNCPKAISYHNHPRTLQQRIEYAKHNRMVPVLLNRYPHLRNKIPGLSDFEPINWRQDSKTKIRWKLRARFFAMFPVRWSFLYLLILLNRYEKFPRLVNALYWRLMFGYGYVGYRDGMGLRKTDDYLPHTA